MPASSMVLRLCKAMRLRLSQQRHGPDLEEKLKEARARGARFIMIATDGVFSMDASFADLASICDLADRYDALVMVDDSPRGRLHRCQWSGHARGLWCARRIDVLTGTLGKALGGASGGYVCAAKPIIELLRPARTTLSFFQHARAEYRASASLAVLRLLGKREGEAFAPGCDEQRPALSRSHGGARLPTGSRTASHHSGDARDAALASRMAQELLARGCLCDRIFLPGGAKGKARIRTQMSAAHAPDQIDRAVAAFARSVAALALLFRTGFMKALAKLKAAPGSP